MKYIKMKMFMILIPSVTFSMMMMISETPLIMWIMMEISNMLFIMMFTMIHTNSNTPALMMLIQFFSSTMIFMGIIENNNIMTSMGTIIKLGLTPAHTWMPMVIYSTPWKLNMLLMTLPKIPPFLLIDLISDKSIIFISTTLTPLILAMKLTKTNDVKMIMALSSMIHSSWMTLAYLVSFKCWTLYFFLYTLNTFMMCNLMMKNMPNNNLNKTTKIVVITMMFSMMATPPITMFASKLYLIFLTNYLLILPLISLVVSSAMSILFYSRIFMKSIFMQKKTNKIKTTQQNNIHTKWIMLMMLIMLII